MRREGSSSSRRLPSCVKRKLPLVRLLLGSRCWSREQPLGGLQERWLRKLWVRELVRQHLPGALLRLTCCCPALQLWLPREGSMLRETARHAGRGEGGRCASSHWRQCHAAAQVFMLDGAGRPQGKALGACSQRGVMCSRPCTSQLRLLSSPCSSQRRDHATSRPGVSMAWEGRA